MTKLTGAALDRAVANAMGLKSVHNCEKWREHMNRIEEDDDIQDYKRPWIGLTDGDIAEIYNQKDWDIHSNWDYERAIEAKLKEKNT
jgi:hypothetical protein